MYWTVKKVPGGEGRAPAIIAAAEAFAYESLELHDGIVSGCPAAGLAALMAATGK